MVYAEKVLHILLRFIFYSHRVIQGYFAPHGVVYLYN